MTIKQRDEIAAAIAAIVKTRLDEFICENTNDISASVWRRVIEGAKHVYGGEGKVSAHEVLDYIQALFEHHEQCKPNNDSDALPRLDPYKSSGKIDNSRVVDILEQFDADVNMAIKRVQVCRDAQMAEVAQRDASIKKRIKDVMSMLEEAARSNDAPLRSAALHELNDIRRWCPHISTSVPIGRKEDSTVRCCDVCGAEFDIRVPKE